MIHDAGPAPIHELEALLGSDAVSVTDLPRWSVDGAVPRAVVRPPDAAQAAEVLRLCAASGASVAPWGGGTAIEVGNLPRAADVILRTDRLSAVVEHDHSNMTVTVQGGMTLGVLDGVLAAHRQFLPLEPPRAEAATAGGAIAANLNGPRRMHYGSARDFVIGIRVAQTDGAVTKAGGKTVKNVAGYDMGRLFVGSLGTLGVITEVTFKVAPIPEASKTVAVWSADGSRLTDLAQRLSTSALDPSAVVFVNRAAGERLSGSGTGLLVRAEGIEPAVARHERDILEWAAGAGLDAEAIGGERESSLWLGVRDFAWRDAAVAVRVSVPPGKTAAVLNDLDVRLPSAAGVLADLGTGTLWVVFESADDAAPALAAMDGVVARHGGNLLVARAPRTIKAGRDVWMPPPQERALEIMRSLKRAFDPHSILNPGRYVAGL